MKFIEIWIVLLIIAMILTCIYYVLSDVSNVSSKIGIVSMMKEPKNVETWLDIHRKLGISFFFIRLEDTPSLVDYLSSQSDVLLDVSKSSGTNEYVEIQTRQNAMVNKALIDARERNIDWLIHIDSDEIINGDLNEIRNLPENIDIFWMQNYEALYESIPEEKDNCFRAKRMVNCHTDTCVSYVNGKGGGRTSSHISCNGPHRFASSKSSECPKINIIVEHYESCDFLKYKSKYENLAKQTIDNKIPFPYYNDSIRAFQSGDETEIRNTYIKYRVDK